MDAETTPGCARYSIIPKRGIPAVELANIIKGDDGRLYICIVADGREHWFEAARDRVAFLVGQGAVKLV